MVCFIRCELETLTAKRRVQGCMQASGPVRHQVCHKPGSVGFTHLYEFCRTASNRLVLVVQMRIRVQGRLFCGTFIVGSRGCVSGLNSATLHNSSPLQSMRTEKGDYLHRITYRHTVITAYKPSPPMMQPSGVNLTRSVHVPR